MTPPRITAFPSGSDLWRIDWLGPLAFSHRAIRFSQPSVQVRLSKALKPIKQALGQPATGEQHIFNCWVSVGALMLLRVGDLWRDRMLVSAPDHHIETFTDLRIDRSTVRVVKAGSAIGPNCHLIPFRDYAGHRGDTSSNCICVSLSDGRRLIVPCMELVRFYFGSTSGLLSRLFTPPLEREHLYLDETWDFSHQLLTLHLADGIRGPSAVDIARIATDMSAWRAALSISTSCARASAIGAPAYPTTTFPFEGSTDLVASGKWLTHGGEPNRTFLVYTLRSCSHPFRFQKLRYKLTSSTRSTFVDGSTSEANRGGGERKRVRRPPAKGESLLEQEASKSLTATTRHINERQRFRDLERKSVWSMRALHTSDGAMPIVNSPSNQLAVGDANGTGHARPVSLVIAKEAKQPPDFLQELIETLRHVPNADLLLLTGSDEDGWTILHWFDSPGILCRFAVFLIDRPTAQAKVIAMESKTLTVLLRPCLPAVAQRLLEEAIEDLRSFLMHGMPCPDLELDLDEKEEWTNHATRWIENCLEECVFPVFRS